MPYYVYILKCKGGTFYTGSTQDIEARVKLHKIGRGSRYVKAHPAKKVVYMEIFETRGKAMRREREIKRLTHAEKLKLIKSKL